MPSEVALVLWLIGFLPPGAHKDVEIQNMESGAFRLHQRLLIFDTSESQDRRHELKFYKASNEIADYLST